IIDESGGASDGFTDVREGGPGVGYDDTYKIYLAHAPKDGTHVYVTVSGAMSPQNEHGNNGLLNSGDIIDTLGTGDSLLVSETAADYNRHIILNGVAKDVPKRAIVLVFDSSNWNLPQTVNVRAVDDSADEGDRVVTISHS